MQLIPAIDLRGGRCVRLFQGKFEAETDYAVDPRELVERYDRLGAAWLHVVDLDGAKDGIGQNFALIASLVESPSLRVQVGGGIRDELALRALLDTGVSRAVIGSLAVTAPERVNEFLREFGAERIVLAFDVRIGEDRVPRVATHGWKNQSTLSLWEALAHYGSRVRHVLCTDVARDGAMSGPNLSLYREATTRFPELAWQASGGVRDVADLHALQETGVSAAISGRALLERTLEEKELRPFLPSASSPV